MKVAVENAHGIEIVGTSRSSTEMVAFLDTHACDVLVTDYSMPGGAYGDGIPLLSFVMRRYAIETGLVSAATPQSPEEQA